MGRVRKCSGRARSAAGAGIIPLALLAILFALAAPRTGARTGAAPARADGPPRGPTPASTRARMGAPTARAAGGASPAVVSEAALESYALHLAEAWESETEADGVVRDPLIPAGSSAQTDGSARFMIIMMADAMLRLSALEREPALASTAERILAETVSLPAASDPFNLLGLASLIRDGERGLLPASAWQRLAGPLIGLADQITFPTPREMECSHQLECYNNHWLVWAAGAGMLLDDHLPENGGPGTLLGEPARVTARIAYDLEQALVNSSPPAKASSGATMRELSDPGEEPSAYHILSTWMLNTVAQYSPGAVTPALDVLKGEAESYALAMMAPDGQLSLAGRSLDQSWVQAAAASLGAEEAQPSGGGPWGEFANSALQYLLDHYPTLAGGTLAIVPGLALDWNPSLVDSYAEDNQFNGLTLWFLVEALSDWSNVAHSTAPTGVAPTTTTEAAPPTTTTGAAPATTTTAAASPTTTTGAAPPTTSTAGTATATPTLPADGNLLVDDLVSSGLVWGRYRQCLVDGQRANDRRRSPQRTRTRGRQGARPRQLA